ncbi:MAG TPA: CbtA family protein [Bauldia sp.]|nr:CbtA family protein [Bauldia sp.]
MFKTIVFSAAGAGVLACVALTALQSQTTEPLILHAEVFEDAGGGHDHGPAAPPAATSDATAPAADAPADAPGHAATPAEAEESEEWGPADGFERTAFTALANLVIGVAVALVLLGGMLLRGDPIDGRRGVLWGLAGFAAASLLPALGLPPELPGTPAADVVDRQLWWIGTAAASAAGIALLVFGPSWMTAVLGLILLVAPHVGGAPPPPSHEAAYPAGLAGEFVAASLVVSAVLWSLAGWSAGWLYRRMEGAA